MLKKTSHAANISIGRHPTFPIPLEKHVGGLKFQYSGTSPTIRQRHMGVQVHFAHKAVAGGDLAAFMAVTLPANHPGPIPNHQRPTKVSVHFHNGETPLAQAKQLEAAIKDKVKTGYMVSRHGSTVTIDMLAMAFRT